MSQKEDNFSELVLQESKPLVDQRKQLKLVK